MAESDRLVEPEMVDDGQHVGGEAVPAEVLPWRSAG
jgi:hypothetical protein